MESPPNRDLILFNEILNFLYSNGYGRDAFIARCRLRETAFSAWRELFLPEEEGWEDLPGRPPPPAPRGRIIRSETDCQRVWDSLITIARFWVQNGDRGILSAIQWVIETAFPLAAYTEPEVVPYGPTGTRHRVYSPAQVRIREEDRRNLLYKRIREDLLQRGILFVD